MSLFPELSSPEHRRLLLPSCDQGIVLIFHRTVYFIFFGFLVKAFIYFFVCVVHVGWFLVALVLVYKSLSVRALQRLQE